MKAVIFSTMVLGLALGTACAQDASSAAPAGQAPDQRSWQGRRGGAMGGMGPGRGLQGTVTEVAADHYTIKTESGDIYTVHFSANTRIMKQPAERHAPGEGRQAGDYQRPAPQMLKSTDIKVGDPVIALGEVDSSARSVGAMAILQVDPERARQMREMQANYGKTWLMGKVTAIDGVKVTLTSGIDNAAHAFVADENTSFRKHREPITLADIQVGDNMRVEGALKDGTFVATAVNVMGMPPGGTPNVPRNAQPAATPQADPQPK